MIRTLPALALLVGCLPAVPDDDPFDTSEPDGPCAVVATPSRLDFELAASEAPSEPRLIKLVNDCPGEVTLYDLTAIEGDGAFRITDPGLGLYQRLRPGDVVEVPVVFDPPHGGRFEATLAVRATDPEAQPDPILLVGDASGPSPELSALQPRDTLQFCSAPVEVELLNRGPDALVIRDLRLADESDCDAFTIATTLTDGEPVVGATVPTGGRLDLPVTFRPERVARYACTLELVTDLAAPVPVQLLGNGTANAIAQESFRTSDGSGANVLVLYDDAAPDVADARSRLADGLPFLLEGLRREGVDYRITAASTDDACTVGPDRYATAADSDALALGVLGDNLFDDAGTTWADRPLALLAEVAARAGGTCFAGWYEDHEPLHTLIVAARDDASPRSVNVYLNQAFAELPGSLSISVLAPGGSCGPVPGRLYEAVGDTSGLARDLCAPDWSETWSALAAHTADLRRVVDAWDLAVEPLAGSVRVAIDGEVTDAFDVAGARVALTEEVPDGSQVEIRYVDPGTCR